MFAAGLLMVAGNGEARATTDAGRFCATPADSRLTRFRVGTLAIHFERIRGLTLFRLFTVPVHR